MARKASPPGRNDLNLGDAFAVRLSDGRWTVLRVLRVGTQEQRRDVLVGATAWIGDEPPPLDEPRLRLLLVRTAHDQDGRPVVFWVRDQALPESLTRLGTIEPSPGEAALGEPGYDEWDNFLGGVLGQWRHDEEQGVAPPKDEAEQRRRAHQAAHHHAIQRRRECLENLSPQKVREVLDDEWDPGEGTHRRFRRYVREAVAALQTLGPDGDEVAKLDVLRDFVERLNRDDEGIDTIERENLCELFEELVWLAGLEEYGEALMDPPWRDW